MWEIGVKKHVSYISNPNTNPNPDTNPKPGLNLTLDFSNRYHSDSQQCEVWFDLIWFIYPSNGEGIPSAEALIFKGPSHKLKLN